MTAADRPSVTDNARAEAWRRFPNGIDVETGEPVDDYGYPETAREAFIGGAEWAAGRAETTTATLMARRGGKTQALIESLLSQAKDRGLTVEVVYPTETEWGVRWRPDDYEAAPDEDTARLWAASDTGHPVALVRREVTDWTEADQ